VIVLSVVAHVDGTKRQRSRADERKKSGKARENGD
jgi:hypothetical protein